MIAPGHRRKQKRRKLWALLIIFTGSIVIGVFGGGALSIILQGSGPKSIGGVHDQDSTTNEEISSRDHSSLDDSAENYIPHSLAHREELKAILKEMVPGKPVLATISNFAFSDMMVNWYRHTQKSGISNVLVVSLDAKQHEICAQYGIKSLLLSGSMNATFFRADIKVFRDMGSLKSAIIVTTLGLGWEILMSDTDVAWVSNPEDFLSPHGPMGHADVIISSDSISVLNDIASMHSIVTTSDRWFQSFTSRSQEYYGNVYRTHVNSGVLFFRPTKPSQMLASEWHTLLRTHGAARGWNHSWSDQFALNELICHTKHPISVVEPPPSFEKHNRVIWTRNNTLKLGIFSPSEVAPGHVYFVQRRVQQLGTPLFAIHNTFQFHSKGGKVARFREEGLWLLDDKKYYTEGNFLSFDAHLPPWIESQTIGVEKHKAAMMFYYEATRKAVAVAQILNRTLILPRVTCFCDRWWSSLLPPCRAPGSDVDPPFDCPVDYFLHISAWDWGNISYRHKNFLLLPEVDPDIAKSKVSIEPGVETDAGALKLRANSSDADVALLQERLHAVRLVHLPRAIDSFCRFDKESANRDFDFHSLPGLTLNWCCGPNGETQRFTVPPLSNVTSKSFHPNSKE